MGVILANTDQYGPIRDQYGTILGPTPLILDVLILLKLLIFWKLKKVRFRYRFRHLVRHLGLASTRTDAQRAVI